MSGVSLAVLVGLDPFNRLAWPRLIVRDSDSIGKASLALQAF